MALALRLGMLVRVAWRSLLRNKIRTLLTMLGIIIGVAAVIAMVAMGNGAQARMEEEMLTFGKNTIEVRSKPTIVNGVEKGDTASLTEEDAEQLKAACPAVLWVSPEIWGAEGQVVYHDQHATAQTMGVSPDYLAMHHYSVSEGRDLTEDDITRCNRVCVVGAVTADQVFGNRDPIGLALRVKTVSLTVVGVRTYTGGDGWRGRFDKMVYVPYTTVLRDLRRSRHFWSVNVATASPDDMEAAKDQVDVYLRQHHHIHGNREPDYRIEDIEAMLADWRQQQAIFSALLGGVAAISLLVGGIGIMNIMLVTVTERIREIGTRLALGARPSDIMLQFFTEALTMSLMGGAFGILLGVATAKVVDEKWSAAIVSPASLVLAFGVSCVIGVFFGFYPAWKASQMDPIEALRQD